MIESIGDRKVDDVPSSNAGIVCINIDWVSVLHSCASMGLDESLRDQREETVYI